MALESARRSYLNLLDIPTKTRLVAVTPILYGDISITNKEALEAAFTYRSDYQQAIINRKSAKLGLISGKSEQRDQVDLVLSSDPNTGSLNFSLPFGDVPRDQSIKRAQLAMSEQEIALLEIRSLIENEILNLVADVDTAARQISLARRSEELAAAQLLAEQKKFNQGLSSTRDLLEIEDVLSDTKLASLNANVRYNQSLTDLDRAMGTTLSTWGVTAE